MVVGYSLGNRQDQENDILVLGEDAPDIITYSKALPVVLSRMCSNTCGQCGFRKPDSLVVPYSTIRTTKQARVDGMREAVYIAGERLDRFPQIRATLDLWGFHSYLEYLYSVCELGFLEGLIPVLDIGFLAPEELKYISEICAMIKVSLNPYKSVKTVRSNATIKRMQLFRQKNIEWAGKLKLPTAVTVMVGMGEEDKEKKDIFEWLKNMHLKHDHIHEVVLQNYIPVIEKGKKPAKSGPTKTAMLKTFNMAKNILPPDVHVIVPIEWNSEIEPFIKAGMRDLGRLYQASAANYIKKPDIEMKDLEKRLGKMGFRLQQRFPLRKDIIKKERYSKKLGQVFDAYRYKIKKEETDRLKEGVIAK